MARAPRAAAVAASEAAAPAPAPVAAPPAPALAVPQPVPATPAPDEAEQPDQFDLAFAEAAAAAVAEIDSASPAPASAAVAPPKKSSVPKPLAVELEPAEAAVPAPPVEPLAPPPEPAAPAPQLRTEPAPPPQVYQEPPLFSPEEATQLQTFFNDWPDVARATETMIRGLVTQTVRRMYADLAGSLAPYQHTIDTLADRSQLSELQDQVSDYDTVSGQLSAWAGKQPAYLRGAYEHVIKSGTAAEVVDLINRYKQDMQSTM